MSACLASELLGAEVLEEKDQVDPSVPPLMDLLPTFLILVNSEVELWKWGVRGAQTLEWSDVRSVSSFLVVIKLV